MQLAFDTALEGMKNHQGGPFGAVVVKDGEVIAKASNSVLAGCDPTAHAEINAIRKACLNLNTPSLEGCVLYATGEPCPMCLSAIIWANIKEVYYANEVKKAEEIGFRDEFIYKHLRGEEKAISVLKLENTDYCQELYQEYKKMQGIIY